MDRRPEIHWPTALSVARFGRGELPDVGRPEAARVVADLRFRGRDAARVAARTMRVPRTGGATDVRVVDRDGWVEEARAIGESALDALGWPRRSAGLRRELTGRGIGALVGLGLGAGSRWLLGQYDAWSGRRRLVLVAPNVVATERRHRFKPYDFRRWVAAHEQTHALQFSEAPWLRDHLVELVQGSGSRATVDRIIATMTFLEGHADFISDTTGGIRTARTMRKVFARRPTRGGGLFDKHAQYANGLAFCLAVRGYAPRNPLQAAFERPEHLPTRAEIQDPKAWFRRVHGAS